MSRKRARYLDLNDPRAMALANRKLTDYLAPSAEDELEADVIPVTDAELIAAYPISLTAGGAPLTFGSNVSVFTATQETTIVAVMLSKVSTASVKQYFLRVQVIPAGGSAKTRATVAFHQEDAHPSQHFVLPIALRINPGETCYLALACETASATADAGMSTYVGPLS